MTGGGLNVMDSLIKYHTKNNDTYYSLSVSIANYQWNIKIIKVINVFKFKKKTNNNFIIIINL